MIENGASGRNRKKCIMRKERSEEEPFGLAVKLTNYNKIKYDESSFYRLGTIIAKSSL